MDLTISHKSGILDDSTLAHVLLNPCGRHNDKEPTNPLKDSMVVFLMGHVEFLRDD